MISHTERNLSILCYFKTYEIYLRIHYTMRNEGLFSVTELIVQRIPGVKYFPWVFSEFFFNHKHRFLFWVFSMSHLSLTQTAISIKYVKRNSIAQGVFNHSISLNYQFFMCNAWTTIIVSFLKTFFLWPNTLLGS